VNTKPRCALRRDKYRDWNNTKPLTARSDVVLWQKPL